jgi:hypothetical protein
MPYFIARLIGLLPCIAHFQPFVLVLLLVASLMGMLIPLLLYRLPLAKSIPAILLQLGLLGLIFWQWLHAWTLRQRVEELEDELYWLTA